MSAPAARCAACPVGPGLRCPGPCGKAGTAPHWDAHIRAVAAATAPAPRAAGAGADAWLAPRRDPASGVAPDHASRPWEGCAGRRPWEYLVTAAIVHLDAPGLLAAVIATLRAQTERPFILVVDAGSLSRHDAALGALEAEDVELVRLRPRAWRFTSEPVAVGMDVAFARCQTRYCYSTHVDVFLKRPDYLEYLVGLCRRPGVVAAGYQMSPRPASGNDWWTRTLSHTATLYDMPAMRRYGASWSMLAAFERAGLEPRQPHFTGWPDTETNLGMVLHDRGVGVRWLGDPDPGPGDPESVLMIGTEPNEPYEDANLRHERSFTSHALYNAPGAGRRRERLEAEARAAIARAARWTRDRALGRVRDCPDRGSVLPLALQPAGCCGPGPEVSACGAGKGAVPGRVTLADCLACVGG